MIVTNDYRITYPVEIFENWMKENGINDGVMLENYKVQVEDISFDRETRYITVDGSISQQIDG